MHPSSLSSKEEGINKNNTLVENEIHRRSSSNRSNSTIDNNDSHDSTSRTNSAMENTLLSSSRSKKRYMKAILALIANTRFWGSTKCSSAKLPSLSENDYVTLDVQESEDEPLAADQPTLDIENQDHNLCNDARVARMVSMCDHIIKAIWSWVLWKWFFRGTNVLIEVLQAILSQENGQKKISDSWYMKFSAITSLACLVISLVEIIGECKESKAKWQRRSYCCWFYYLGTQRRWFGKFSLYFGVVSSMIQFLINLVTLMIHKIFLKFDSLPLMLSIAHLVGPLVEAMANPNEHLVVKCGIHGDFNVQCPQCQQNTSTSLGEIRHESN